jgi:predicted DNA-binding transcriptional regulator AlpA
METRVAEAIIRRKQAAERLSISLSSLWRYEKSGLIPRAKKFGPNVSGWLSSDFDAALVALAQQAKANLP